MFASQYWCHLKPRRRAWRRQRTKVIISAHVEIWPRDCFLINTINSDTLINKMFRETSGRLFISSFCRLAVSITARLLKRFWASARQPDRRHSDGEHHRAIGTLLIYFWWADSYITHLGVGVVLVVGRNRRAHFLLAAHRDVWFPLLSLAQDEIPTRGESFPLFIWCR